MAAIENIIAWAKHEQVRLTARLAELQSGYLRIVEKHAHLPGWLEIDTTEHSIEVCRQYLSELNAIIALHPAVVPTAPAAPAPVPRFIAPVQQPTAEAPAETPLPRRNLMHSDIHPDWLVGWGVVKGQPPGWELAGIYASHDEANEAAAEAGEGFYARWGSYNPGSKEFTSGPSFDRVERL
jgi:hypothetical protein